MRDVTSAVSDSIRISRRDVLGLTFSLVLATGTGASQTMAQPSDERPEVCPNNIGTHNMLLFGERSAFVSHLPMFVGLCLDGAHFVTEHRFQLILEASFEGQRTRHDVTALYREDRQRNPQIRMYSLNPRQEFALSDIFETPISSGRRRSFPADVYRDHFERGGVIIPGLRGTTVQITRVVYAHEFLPAERDPEELEYILFGTSEELFLAHRIVAPGNFDQILPVKIPDQQLSNAELSQVSRVVVSGQPNVSSGRLREGQSASAQILDQGAPARSVTLQAFREIYFEESELAMPMIPDTQEERDAGF